jgi:hypothetical protein
MFWKRWKPKLRPTMTTPAAGADELDALRRASAGLLYPSESDAPFDVFRWDAPGDAGGSATKAVAAHSGGGEPVEETSLDAFFTALDGSQDAARFRELRRAVESSLTSPTVVRVGERKIDVYLIGRTRSGAWAGLHTTSVET